MMSELTKLAEIIAKNLSDAFLAMASDFRKLNAASPLSQASKSDDFVSIERTVFRKLFTYSPRDRILVLLEGSKIPTKYRILERISETEYLAYAQRELKSSARKITVDQIMGLDPDR